jgi:hypothetical protein
VEGGKMKALDELIENNNTWETIKEWISDSVYKIEVLPIDSEHNKKVLYNLQVSTNSVLGSIAFNTGGLLIDNCWLRILGSGCMKLNRNLSSWNQIELDGKATLQSGSLLVADDAVGGFFAINGGAFSGEIGNVFYMAPDTLEWEDLEIGYSSFLKWALTGDISKFYESFRWKGWKDEVNPMSCDDGVLIYPYLWAVGEEIENRSRKIVPIRELWELNQDNILKLQST